MHKRPADQPPMANAIGRVLVRSKNHVVKMVPVIREIWFAKFVRGVSISALTGAKKKCQEK